MRQRGLTFGRVEVGLLASQPLTSTPARMAVMTITEVPRSQTCGAAVSSARRTAISRAARDAGVRMRGYRARRHAALGRPMGDRLVALPVCTRPASQAERARPSRVHRHHEDRAARRGQHGATRTRERPGGDGPACARAAGRPRVGAYHRAHRLCARHPCASARKPARAARRRAHGARWRARQSRLFSRWAGRSRRKWPRSHRPTRYRSHSFIRAPSALSTTRRNRRGRAGMAHV